jgi:hypothetical protein
MARVSTIACSLALLAVLCPARALAASAQSPYESTWGGFGIYALLMAASVVAEHAEDVDGGKGHARGRLDPAGGFGLFGEALVKPTFAIGGEVILAFPDIDDIKSRVKPADGDWSDWSDWVHCSPCDNGVVFQATLRMRWPLSVHPWVRIYPLLSIGIGNYTARYREVTWWWWSIDPDDTNYFGLAYTAGFGVEISTPVPVTPFLELRYIGGIGGNTEKDSDVEHDMIVLNSFSIVLLGLRFF